MSDVTSSKCVPFFDEFIKELKSQRNNLTSQSSSPAPEAKKGELSEYVVRFKKGKNDEMCFQHLNSQNTKPQEENAAELVVSRETMDSTMAAIYGQAERLLKRECADQPNQFETKLQE
jgi:hypothetical protein